MAHAHTHSFKVADKLYLVRNTLQQDPGAPAKAVETPTDHIVIFDCSGSMSWDLPKIREQVKKKLPKMLKKEDTFSAIWFSGKGQCGILLEQEPVASLTDLAAVNKAVDRWLAPQGLTGFKEPLEKALDLASKLGGKGRAISLTFMSDGCDNQWLRSDILKVTEKLGPKVSSSTFVEYGYYADRPLLTAMAEKAGGVLIFAEDFDRYEPAFEAAMTKKTSGAKRVEVDIKGDPIGGFAYALHDGDLMTFSAKGSVAVPENLTDIYYLSPSVIGTQEQDIVQLSEAKGSSGAAIDATYAALSLFAVRMKSDVVFPLLKALGDVKLIDQFASCFGKQKYSAFMEDAKALAFAKDARWANGWDPKKVPREDAFTVMHVLELLQVDPNARLLLDNPNFKYSKIGRGRIDTSANLTEADLDELHKLTDQLSKEKDVTKIKELNAKIASFTEGKSESLKFVPTPQPDGYPILKLTFNEDRPNISILTKKPGTIDLSKRLSSLSGGPKFASIIPANFETYVYRNYAIVKDGLTNVDVLPVRISRETAKKLQDADLPAGTMTLLNVGTSETADFLIDLKKLPVVNRQMVKAVSAKAFFTTQYELVKAQAAQKVFNSYSKELLPERKVAGFVEKYGDDGAKWLKEQGIGDGYQPPSTKQAEATDFYMGKELAVTLAKYSKLPSLKEAKEQIAKGKLNPAGTLMSESIKRVESFLVSDAYSLSTAKDEVLQTWLTTEKKAATEKVRKLIFDIAQTTFAIIVGQVWFAEFSSLDEGSMDIDVDGQRVTCKAEMRDIEIKI
jgi:hypothetical protein